MTIRDFGRCEWSRRTAITVLLCALAAIGGGCGVGSSSAGPAATATIEGTLLMSETDAPPTAASTVSAGGQSATAAANDGAFTIPGVSTNANQLTITSTGAKTRTLPITLTANGTLALGDVFLSNTGYTASVTGSVATIVNGSATPVPNATVTIGNVTGVTDANGAYALSGLPIGLGAGNLSSTAYGAVSAPGFLPVPVSATNLLVNGQPSGLPGASTHLPTIYLAASASTVPGVPYNIRGQVTLTAGSGAPKPLAVPVSVLSGTTPVGTVTPDSTGAYTLWALPGTYTLSATYQNQTKKQTVVLERADKVVTVPTLAFQTQ